MTRADLCALLFGFAPVRSHDVARFGAVSIEEVDAFYRALRDANLVHLDAAARTWVRTREGITLPMFIDRVKALGIDPRRPLGG
jgi:hypothetical protein